MVFVKEKESLEERPDGGDKLSMPYRLFHLWTVVVLALVAVEVQSLSLESL